MKKSIIAAGAASVALAAMPIVGVFAVGNNGTLTDIIQTTIEDSCQFTRQTTKHGGAANAWTSDAETSESTDTMAAVTVAPGSEQTLGTSNFNVVCNDYDGYQVTVSAGNLALPSPKEASHTWNYAAAAPAEFNASYWRLESSDSDVSGYTVDLANNIVSKKTSAEDTHNFTITYKARALATQDSGTYSANVVYTFAQLPVTTGGGA